MLRNSIAYNITGRPKRTEKLMENNSSASNSKAKLVQVPAGALLLDGYLSIPEDARGIVLLAQGSRNLEDDTSFGDIAAALYDAEQATMLVHMLIEEAAMM